MWRQGRRGSTAGEGAGVVVACRPAKSRVQAGHAKNGAFLDSNIGRKQWPVPKALKPEVRFSAVSLSASKRRTITGVVLEGRIRQRPSPGGAASASRAAPGPGKHRAHLAERLPYRRPGAHRPESAGNPRSHERRIPPHLPQPRLLQEPLCLRADRRKRAAVGWARRSIAHAVPFHFWKRLFLSNCFCWYK